MKSIIFFVAIIFVVLQASYLAEATGRCTMECSLGVNVTLPAETLLSCEKAFKLIACPTVSVCVWGECFTTYGCNQNECPMMINGEQVMIDSNNNVVLEKVNFYFEPK